jgi:hypothetical protein
MIPSIKPSTSPTKSPSRFPSSNPVNIITNSPSSTPTAIPVLQPSVLPSRSPTFAPVVSAQPTYQPVISPTMTPTCLPTSLVSLSLININDVGMKIDGRYKVFQISKYIGSIGDINDDSCDDILIANALGYFVYIIFGRVGKQESIVLESTLSDNVGVKLSYPERFGKYVTSCSVGDWNNDGLNDFAIGFPDAEIYRNGRVYIIYGKVEWSDIDLSVLTPDNGFYIMGAYANDRLGISLSSPSSHYATSVNSSSSNRCDVIMGKIKGFYMVYDRINYNFNMINYNNTFGIEILGSDLNDVYGNQFVVFVGDMNNDTVQDFVISCPYSNQVDGRLYVVFGSMSRHTNDINLDDPSTYEGFIISYSAMSTTAAYVGCSVSNIGDINGDGVDDMIIGSYFQGSYILYGSANPEKNYDLSALDTAHGFQITFSKQGSMSGISVAGNFDLNKDGFNDIAIGTPYGIDGNLVYIFFGSNEKARDNIELTMLTNRQGMCIRTENDNDGTGRLLRAVGDFDYDGYNDLLIGSVFALDSSELLIGSAYVLTDMYSMSTYSPSSAPNSSPRPTRFPTFIPTFKPTKAALTQYPSTSPSRTPTSVSSEPSMVPSDSGSMEINATCKPTNIPSAKPSKYPTLTPRNNPSVSPSARPTKRPSSAPSSEPSALPSTSMPSWLDRSYVPSEGSSLVPSISETTSMTEKPTHFDQNSTKLITNNYNLLLRSQFTLAIIFGVVLPCLILIGGGVVLTRPYVLNYLEKERLSSKHGKAKSNCKVLVAKGSKNEVFSYFINVKNIAIDESSESITSYLFQDYADSKVIVKSAIDSFCKSQDKANPIAYYKLCTYLIDSDSEYRDASYYALQLITANRPEVIVDESMTILYQILFHLFDDSKLYAVNIIKMIATYRPLLISDNIYNKLNDMISKDVTIYEKLSASAHDAVDLIAVNCSHLHIPPILDIEAGVMMNRYASKDTCLDHDINGSSSQKSESEEFVENSSDCSHDYDSELLSEMSDFSEVNQIIENRNREMFEYLDLDFKQFDYQISQIRQSK